MIDVLICEDGRKGKAIRKVLSLNLSGNVEVLDPESEVPEARVYLVLGDPSLVRAIRVRFGKSPFVIAFGDNKTNWQLRREGVNLFLKEGCSMDEVAYHVRHKGL